MGQCHRVFLHADGGKKPDSVLVLGDTKSCLSIIGEKCLHISIFHMEAGIRCMDECLPDKTNCWIFAIISDANIAYSSTHTGTLLIQDSRRIAYATGSPMAEELLSKLKIEASNIHACLGHEKGKYILLSSHREKNIDTEKTSPHSSR